MRRAELSTKFIEVALGVLLFVAITFFIYQQFYGAGGIGGSTQTLVSCDEGAISMVYGALYDGARTGCFTDNKCQQIPKPPNGCPAGFEPQGEEYCVPGAGDWNPIGRIACPSQQFCCFEEKGETQGTRTAGTSKQVECSQTLAGSRECQGKMVGEEVTTIGGCALCEQAAGREEGVCTRGQTYVCDAVPTVCQTGSSTCINNPVGCGYMQGEFGFRCELDPGTQGSCSVISDQSGLIKGMLEQGMIPECE